MELQRRRVSPGGLRQLGEQQLGAWSLGRGLHDDGRAHRQRRRHFVRAEVERKVEGDDAHHHPGGEAADLALHSGGGRVEVHRHHAAPEARQLGGRQPEDFDGAVDLGPCQGAWLSRLVADEFLEIAGPCEQSGGDALQDGASCPGALGLEARARVEGEGQGGLGLRLAGLRHPA